MSWQRKWFFWMEALQITAGERRVVLLLLATGMITTGIAQFGPSRSIYDQQYYEPVIAEFKRLSEARETEKAALLARYYPRDERITETGGVGSAFLQLHVRKYGSNFGIESPVRQENNDRRNGEDEHGVLNQQGGQSRHGVQSVQTEQGIQDEQDDQKRKPVRIQSAGKEELVTLPGIGPVTAGRILEYREEKGTIKNLDDLMNVSGIGPVTIENIRDLVVFD